MRYIFLFIIVSFLPIDALAIGNQSIDILKDNSFLEMQVYPNPISFGQTLNVSINGLDKGIQYSNLYLSIYSVIGSKVFEKKISSDLDKFKIQLVIDERFNSNIYFVTLSTEKIQLTQKLLIY